MILGFGGGYLRNWFAQEKSIECSIESHFHNIQSHFEAVESRFHNIQSHFEAVFASAPWAFQAQMAAACRSMLEELSQERLDALVLAESKDGKGSGYTNVLKITRRSKTGTREHFQARCYDELTKKQVSLARVHANLTLFVHLIMNSHPCCCSHHLHPSTLIQHLISCDDVPAVAQVPIATFDTAKKAAQFLALMKEEKLSIPSKEEKMKARLERRGAWQHIPRSVHPAQSPACLCGA